MMEGDAIRGEVRGPFIVFMCFPVVNMTASLSVRCCIRVDGLHAYASLSAPTGASLAFK